MIDDWIFKLAKQRQEQKKAWDEAKHPRKQDGQFAYKKQDKQDGHNDLHS